MVLMDCNMPIMDGYYACEILLEMIEEGKIKYLPILACTADAT